MTPEGKAEQLVERLQKVCGSFGNGIAAANICCDQIMEALNAIIHDDVWVSIEQEIYPTEYWKQVKQHIQTL